MPEPDKPPLPEDPPVTVTDDEVERLLSQAQSLAADIASLTGSGEQPAASTPPVLDAEVPPPDPIAATATVEQTVNELADLVGVGTDGPAAESRPPDEAPAPQETAALLDPPEPPPPVDPTAAVEHPNEAETAGIAFDQALVGEVEVDLDESALPPAPPAGEREDPPRGWRRAASIPLRKRLLDLQQRLTAGAGRFARGMPGGIVGVFVLLDRPFAGLSPTTKQALGYVALVTILMGIASLVVPGLLESNPYAEIPP